MYALASLGSPPLLRGRRGTMCIAKGLDVRPGVPWVSASFAWQAWDNVHCQGLGCTPWRPLGLRLFFAWQARDNVHCQGLGCTPWRPLGLRLFCVAGVGQCALPRARMYALASLGSPPLLRGRRGTMSTAKGSDVRPGVPWVSAAFAWQAWHNVHCQGLGCTPWRPLGLRLFCMAGVAQCALPRARMYALASLGSPPLLRGRHGSHSHTHTLTHSLTQSLYSLPHSLTPSLTHSLYLNIHTHTHKLTHHHRSITLILPLPFLLFYAHSKSKEVGNMWGYLVL